MVISNIIYLLISSSITAGADLSQNNGFAEVDEVRFRGEPGTTPFNGGDRLPFTGPLDQNLPPANPLVVPKGKNDRYEDNERHQQMLKERERRHEVESERDLIFTTPPNPDVQQ